MQLVIRVGNLALGGLKSNLSLVTPPPPPTHTHTHHHHHHHRRHSSHTLPCTSQYNTMHIPANCQVADVITFRTNVESGVVNCTQMTPTPAWYCRPLCSLTLTLAVYGGLLALCLLAGLSRTWAFYWLGTRASVRLHDEMYHSVTRAPARFFDVNPKGQLVCHQVRSHFCFWAEILNHQFKSFQRNKDAC